MKEFKMRFKDFVFDTNPSYIQVITSRDVSNTSVYDGKGITQDISQKPIIVKGKGTFFLDDADEKCAHLSYLLRQGGAGELHCPSLYPIEAIFTEFKYDSSATLGKIEYEFEFTQVCDDKKEIAPLDYIVAYDGDNAFDIAARANMSVDEIMQLNDIESPFSIKKGERVKLR